MHIRDRIRELTRVRAADLLPNPRNWRTHPRKQRDALKSVLDEVGYADALLARETPGGKLMLIDGHLRAETTPETLVPVLVLDVTEAEADRLLVTLDPMAGLAGANAQQLSRLLDDVRIESEALEKVLGDLARSATFPEAEEVEQAGEAGELLKERYSILVDCGDESEQVALLERFTNEGLSCRAFVV